MCDLNIFNVQLVLCDWNFNYSKFNCALSTYQHKHLMSKPLHTHPSTHLLPPSTHTHLLPPSTHTHTFSPPPHSERDETPPGFSADLDFDPAYPQVFFLMVKWYMKPHVLGKKLLGLYPAN